MPTNMQTFSQKKQHFLTHPPTVIYFLIGKALTKYEQPKMKRDARQNAVLFLRNQKTVRISLGLWQKLPFIEATQSTQTSAYVIN